MKPWMYAEHFTQYKEAEQVIVDSAGHKHDVERFDEVVQAARVIEQFGPELRSWVWERADASSAEEAVRNDGFE